VLVLATATSFYYYLRILLAFFQAEVAPVRAASTPPLGASVVLGVSALLTLGVGIWAQAFF
jgi:NADH:ubiquinone oxidoreductase subunit 2 (subunit N)